MQSFVKNIMVFMKKIHSCPQGSQSPWSSSHWNSVVKLTKNQISTLSFSKCGLIWGLDSWSYTLAVALICWLHFISWNMTTSCPSPSIAIGFTCTQLSEFWESSFEHYPKPWKLRFQQLIYNAHHCVTTHSSYLVIFV